MLTCLAPSKVWGIGVGFRSGLGRSLCLPCLGSLFYPTCVAWLACLEYLAGLYRGILRLPIGPLLGGHCLGSLQVQCEAWDTTGTTYFSFCDFRFSGLSFTQHVGGGLVCVFFGKWSNSLSRPRRKFGVLWSTPPLFLLYFPRGARSLSALIAPFVPGHYCVLVIFFGLSVFSFAYVFFLAGSS